MEVCRADRGPSRHKKAMENKELRGELISKGVLGLAVGLMLMAAGIWAGRQLHIVWNIWPSTDGMVVRGSVQESLEVPYAKGGMPVHRYSPVVGFRYVVNGSSYTTEATSVYSADTYEKAAAQLARRYAPGSHHPIRYNPRNPGEILFGVIELGPLAFSFLLLIGGALLVAMGLNWLAMGIWKPIAVAPAEERGIPAAVLPFPDRAQPEPSAATLHCPACGRPVDATEDTCPNCLKSLRAA